MAARTQCPASDRIAPGAGTRIVCSIMTTSIGGWTDSSNFPMQGAGFQQQHRQRGLGAQPVGQHTAGRAGADDDVIELVQGA